MLTMPSHNETRRRYMTMQVMHILAEFARCEDPTELENVEEATKRILDMRDFFDADLEARAAFDEAALRKMLLTSLLMQPGPFKPPPFAPQYADVIEAVARAIYDVEVARGANASSVLIKMMVGKPGSKATPESLQDCMRIETFEESADSWREYATSAVAAYLAHQVCKSASAHCPSTPPSERSTSAD